MKQFETIYMSLIKEMTDPLDNLIQYIISGKAILHLPKSKLLSLVSSSWKYYNKLKTADMTDLYIFKFDFSNSKEVTAVYKYLYNKLSNINEQTKNFYLTDGIEMFLEDYVNTPGEHLPANEEFINISRIYLDTKKMTIDIIQEQLMHYFQENLHIEMLDTFVDFSQYDLSSISELQLSEQNLKYMFKPTEFKLHVNQFGKELKQLKIKIPVQTLLQQMKQCNQISELPYLELYKNTFDNHAPLLTVYCAIKLNIECETVFQILSEELN